MGLGFDLFFYCWKIRPNTEIRDRYLSPSKVVTFLYVSTCLCTFFLKNHVIKVYNAMYYYSPPKELISFFFFLSDVSGLMACAVKLCAGLNFMRT